MSSNLAMGLGKKEGGGVFEGEVDTPMHTMAYFWAYTNMPGLEMWMTNASS